MRQQAPGTATAQDIEDRIKISRFGYFSGRPPGLAAGTKWLIKAHSLSLRSVEYGLRGSMPQSYPKLLT